MGKAIKENKNGENYYFIRSEYIFNFIMENFPYINESNDSPIYNGHQIMATLVLSMLSSTFL